MPICFAHRVGGGEIRPPRSVWGRNWPASGGGYFRLLPYAVSRRLLRAVNQGEARSAVFYMHPWEIYLGQPRVEGIALKSRFRHYVKYSGGTEARLCLAAGFFLGPHGRGLRRRTGQPPKPGGHALRRHGAGG